MANWQTPKSTGEKIGKVLDTRLNAIRIQLLPNIILHNGDGLCYGDKGFAINKIDGEWIYPNVRISEIGESIIGTTLYRNLDHEFIRSLRAERRIPVDIRFEAIKEGYRITIGEATAIYETEHQPANNQQRALQTIIQQLSKLGDTHYIVKNIQVYVNGELCSNTFPYFIPTSNINQWRRELTQ